MRRRRGAGRPEWPLAQRVLYSLTSLLLWGCILFLLWRVIATAVPTGVGKFR